MQSIVVCPCLGIRFHYLHVLHLSYYIALRVVTVFLICLSFLCLFDYPVFSQDQSNPHSVHLSSEPGSKTSVTKELIQQQLKAASSLVQKTPDSAISVYTKLLYQSQYTRYNEGCAVAYIMLCNAYHNKGLYQKSLEAAKEAIKIAEQDKDSKKHWIAAHNFAARELTNLGRMNEAAEYYFKALELLKSDTSIHYPPENIYMNLGSVLQDPYLDLQYIDKAETLLRLKDPNNELGRLLLNKAITINRIKRYDSSEKILRDVLSLGVTRKDTLLQFRSYTTLASTRLYQKRPQEALQFLRKAYAMRQEADTFQENANLFLYSEAHLQLKDYRRAIRYSEQAVENAKRLKLTHQIAEGHGMLAYIHAQAGQYKQAYKHQVLYKELLDSVINERTKNHVQYLEAKFKSSEKDRTLLESQLLITRQMKKLSRNRTVAISAVCGIGVLGLLLFFIVRNNRHKQRLQLRQQEIVQLKSMIEGEEKERERIARDLHDGIGGMLASINMHVSAVQKRYRMLFNSPELEPVMEMIENTTREVRKTAHNLMPDMLMQHSFSEAIRLYCEQVNSAKGLHINLFFGGDIALHYKPVELVLYRILQELIQNIVKHAEATEAVVEIEQTHDSLKIIVEDNGKGFDTNRIKKGFGLQHLQHRVNSLQGYVTIESAPGKGTTVNISLDIITLKNIMAYEHQDSNNG